MTDDLVTWLRAQLDDDEQVANSAMQGPWQMYRIPADDAWQINGTTGTRSVARIPNSGQNEGTMRHIARHDPARVLAEADAKRRTIDRCVHYLRYEDYGGPLAEEVLGLLALPYADRPGYRPEWAPDYAPS